MTKEEKQLVCPLINRYFRMHSIDSHWLSIHHRPAIIVPDDDFILAGLSEVKIDEDSIDCPESNNYGFSATGIAAYTDHAGIININTPVKFGGMARIQSDDDKDEIVDMVITRFHRTQPILPK